MKKATSNLFLLDANVLVALAWPHHPFHRRASLWMELGEAWASCAMTQLAFLRVALNPAVVETRIAPIEALRLLGELVSDSKHVFLGSNPAPADISGVFKHIQGYRQVTDSYLVGVAQHHHAQFLTLDAKLRSLPGVVILT